MHPCLQISEIIRAIFGSIHPHDGFTLRTLSGAMQACKTFYEPAADALWHTLNDLTPLVRCLPSHLWNIETFKDEFRHVCIVHLTRDLDESEWEVILKHSQRVKLLGLGISGSITDSMGKPAWRLSPSVLKRLTGWLWSRGWEVDHSRVLLPSLTHLHWLLWSNGDQSSDCIPLLGGQNLKVLMIMGSGSSPSDSNALESMINALSLIPQSSPNLSQISLSFFPGFSWGAIIKPFSELVRALSHLEKLSCCLPLLDDAYHHLAHLPTFRVLDGEIPSSPDHPVLTNSSEHPIFPQLAELVLNSSTELGSCVSLISRMGSIGMERLSVSTDSEGAITIADARALFVALRRQPSLRILSLCRRMILLTGMNAPIPNQAFLPHDFAPLLKFRNLIEFSLRLDIYLDVDDECLRAMAKAWPQLRILSMFSPKAIGARPRITLAGLLPFAEGCPLLTILAINLDLSVTNPELRAAAKALKWKNHDLRFFHIYYWSPLGDAALFADFLLDLFPTAKVNAIPVCEREGNERMVGSFQAFLRGYGARKVAADNAEREGAQAAEESSGVEMGNNTGY